MPRRLQGADVQKSVARAIGQFDETKALLGLEPLNGRIDRVGHGNGRSPGAAHFGAATKPATHGLAWRTKRAALLERRRAIIIVEAALTRPEILALAHLLCPSPPTLPAVAAIALSLTSRAGDALASPDIVSICAHAKNRAGLGPVRLRF